MTSHRRRSLTTMKQAHEKKRTSPRGRKKLVFDGTSKQHLPLFNKSIYLDIKHGKPPDMMEEQLKKLGAKIEKFLSGEVNYVISTQGPSKGYEKQNNWDDNPQSPSLDNVPSPFSCGPSPTGQTETKKAVVSRGKALAQIACAKNKTSNVVANAEKLGIKVVSFEVASKWLERELKKLEVECKKDANRKENKTKKVKPNKDKKTKSKSLKGTFIKFEAANQHYKPIKSEFGKWPRLNLSAPPGICPFGEAKLKVQHQYGARKPCPSQKNPAGAGLLPAEQKCAASKPVTENVEQPQVVHAAPELVGVPIVITGDVKRHLNYQFKRNVNINKQQGYCDCCEVKFKDVDKHVTGQEHRAFARDKKNYESLDALISEVPSTIKFLQNVLLKHCVLKQSEPAADSISPTDNLLKVAPCISPLTTELAAAPLDEKATLNLNIPRLSPAASASRDQLMLTDTDLGDRQETTPTGEENANDSRPQAVVIRRPNPSGMFTSPRRRQPTPSKKLWVQERSMIFRDSPLASLQPSPSCSSQNFGPGDCSLNSSLNSSQLVNFVPKQNDKGAKHHRSIESGKPLKRVIDFSDVEKDNSNKHGDGMDSDNVLTIEKADNKTAMAASQSDKSNVAHTTTVMRSGSPQISLKSFTVISADISYQQNSALKSSGNKLRAKLKSASKSPDQQEENKSVNQNSPRTVARKNKLSVSVERVDMAGRESLLLSGRETLPQETHKSQFSEESLLYSDLPGTVNEAESGKVKTERPSTRRMMQEFLKKTSKKEDVVSSKEIMQTAYAPSGEHDQIGIDKLCTKVTSESAAARQILDGSDNNQIDGVVPCIADRVKHRHGLPKEPADHEDGMCKSQMGSSSTPSQQSILVVIKDASQTDTDEYGRADTTVEYENMEMSSLGEEVALVRKVKSNTKSANHGHNDDAITRNTTEFVEICETKLDSCQERKDDVADNTNDSKCMEAKQMCQQMTRESSDNKVHIENANAAKEREYSQLCRGNCGKSCSCQDGSVSETQKIKAGLNRAPVSLDQNDCEEHLPESPAVVHRQSKRHQNPYKRRKTKNGSSPRLESSPKSSLAENIASSLKKKTRFCKLFTHEGMYANDGEGAQNLAVRDKPESQMADLVVPNIADNVKSRKRMRHLSEQSANDGDGEESNAEDRQTKYKRRVVKVKRRLKGHIRGRRSFMKDSEAEDNMENIGETKCLSPCNEQSGEEGSSPHKAIVPNIAEVVKRRRSCTMFNHEGQYANSGEGTDNENLTQQGAKCVRKSRGKHDKIRKGNDEINNPSINQSDICLEDIGVESRTHANNTKDQDIDKEIVDATGCREKVEDNLPEVDDNQSSDVVKCASSSSAICTPNSQSNSHAKCTPNSQGSAVVIRRKKSTFYPVFPRKQRMETDWGKCHTNKDWSINEDDGTDNEDDGREDAMTKDVDDGNSVSLHEMSDLRSGASHAQRKNEDKSNVKSQKGIVKGQDMENNTSLGTSTDSTSIKIKDLTSDEHTQRQGALCQSGASPSVPPTGTPSRPRWKLKIRKLQDGPGYSSELERISDEDPPSAHAGNRSNEKDKLCGGEEIPEIVTPSKSGLQPSTTASKRQIHTCTPSKQSLVSDTESIDLLHSSPCNEKSKRTGRLELEGCASTTTSNLSQEEHKSSQKASEAKEKGRGVVLRDGWGRILLIIDEHGRVVKGRRKKQGKKEVEKLVPKEEIKVESPPREQRAQSPSFSSPIANKNSKSPCVKQDKTASETCNKSSSVCKSPVFKMTRKNLRHLQANTQVPPTDTATPSLTNEDGLPQLTLREAGLEASVTIEGTEKTPAVKAREKRARSSDKKETHEKSLANSADAGFSPEKKRIKLNESEHVGSNKSEGNFLDEEDDYDSWDDIPIAPPESRPPTDISDSVDSPLIPLESSWGQGYVESSEMTWLSSRDLKSSSEEDGSDSEFDSEDFTNFVPNFSSPGKATNSSWGDVCDMYLSTTMTVLSRPGTSRNSPKQNNEKIDICSPFKVPSVANSPNVKSMTVKKESPKKVLNLSSKGKSGKGSKDTKSSSRKGKQSQKDEKSCSKTSNGSRSSGMKQGFSTPVKKSHKEDKEHSPGVRRVDKEISFNYLSPQRTNFSPSRECDEKGAKPVKMSAPGPSSSSNVVNKLTFSPTKREIEQEELASTPKPNAGKSPSKIKRKKW